jgi:hypothetical protein
MTYVQPPTARTEILLSLSRILLTLGAIVAIWLMAPAAAKAVEGTEALNDPVGTVTEEVVTTQSPSETLEQDTAGSTAGAATDTAGKATDAVTDTVGSTAGAATDTAGKATDAVTDTVGSTAGAATDTGGRATDAVTDTVGSTMETATRVVAQTVPRVSDVSGEVARATLEVVDVLGQSATGGLDRMTGTAAQLLEDETSFVRIFDEASAILADPVLGSVGGGIVEQAIRSLDEASAVVSTEPQRDADADVAPTGSTVVGGVRTTQPANNSIDLETAARDHRIDRLATAPLPLLIATSAGAPASDAPSTHSGEPVPIGPATPEEAVPTGTAARDTMRGGSSTHDLAALAAPIFIALALVRWSRREAELRYSPVFLSLAERPG